MNTREFVESLVDRLFARFPQQQHIAYEYDVMANTHFFLLGNNVYSDDAFPDFDSEITREAYEENVQGQICFTTDKLLLGSSEAFYNPYDNNVVMSKLHHFVDPRNFEVDLNIFERQPGIIANESFHFAGENDLALAA